VRAGHATHAETLAPAQERPQSPAARDAQAAVFANAAGASAKAIGAGAAGLSSTGLATNGASARGIAAVPASVVRTPPAAGMLPSDSASASAVGSMLGQLQQLSLDDPPAFQDAAASVANRLQQSASTANDTTARALDSMATSFRAAAQTGHVPTLSAPPSASAPSHIAVAKYAQSVAAGGADDSLDALHDALAGALAA